MTSAAAHTAGTRLRRRVLAASTSTTSNIAAAEWTSTQRRGLARGFRDVGNVKDCRDHQATTRRRRRHKRRPQRQLQTSFRLSRLPHTACSQRRGITAAKFKALSCRPMCELADYCVHCPAVKIYHALRTDLLPTCRRLDLSLVLSSLVSILHIKN